MKKIIASIVTLTLFATGSTLANAESQSETNQKNVVAFYNEVTNNKDFNAALNYIGSHYVQHNPMAADGTEGLKGYIQFLHDKYPKAHSDIKRVVSNDDYVILHVHSVLEPNTRGMAVVDIFKLDHGKIVEHWDVIQDVPEKSANPNGMF